MSYARVVQRNGLVYKRVWRGSLLFSFLNPLLFLTAMGMGLGSYVNKQDPAAFGGVGFLSFFATGMLPATCMNAAVFESAWPIFDKFTWTKTYHAMLSTPLRLRDLLFGDLCWLGLRLLMIAIPFFGVMAALGVIRTAQAALAIPLALLFGLGIGSWVMGYSATIQHDDAYNWLFRFLITPLFLFSGTFFPLDGAPPWIRAAANFTPLYHAIRLIRSAVFNSRPPYNLSFTDTAFHLTYLVVFLAAGCAFALRRYKKKLIY